MPWNLFVDTPFRLSAVTIITVRVLRGGQGVAMASMLYVMAILGCGDASAACQTVRVADTLYATAAQCEAAAATVLGRNTDLDFPMLETRCQAEQAESARAKLASLPRG